MMLAMRCSVDSRVRAAAVRYLLLLMSLFSVYMGLIYNDTFGTAQPLFGSAWTCKALPAPVGNGTVPIPSCPGLNSKATCCPVDASGARAVYPFGIDPVWALAANKLTFYNSFKMKMSVIFGVIHMTVGTCCKLSNALYFHRPRDIFFEVIPEFVFMQCTFGYLVFLIFYKWHVDWIARGVEAPPLLDTLIQMFMGLGAVPKDPHGVDLALYQGQEIVQRILLVLALVSVPMLLIPKPCLIYHDHKNQYKEVKKDDGEEHDDHEKEHDFSEVVVHQVIHTIEYVLGAVSNTASYLSAGSLRLQTCPPSPCASARPTLGRHGGISPPHPSKSTAHRTLHSPVGSQPRALATQRGVLGTRAVPICRHPGLAGDRRHILCVHGLVRVHVRRPHGDGVSKCLAACSSLTLGRVPEQIL
jgi:vacuolar-type H+-ATPase subunit I/STV1